MQQTQRSWLSLWVTIHFVILALCLLNNSGGSELMSRLARAVAPYAITLHQDYGNLPLYMTGGEELDMHCRLEVHQVSAPADQWQVVETSGSNWLGPVDPRGTNLSRMFSIAGEDKNEDILNLIFDQVVYQFQGSDLAIDAVRLRRVTAASYQQAALQATGELPPGVIEDRTLFECKIVQMPGGTHRLLPVLDKVRRAQVAGASN